MAILNLKPRSPDSSVLEYFSITYFFILSVKLYEKGKLKLSIYLCVSYRGLKTSPQVSISSFIETNTHLGLHIVYDYGNV